MMRAMVWLWLLIGGVALIPFVSASGAAGADEAEKQVVTLIIDFGDGFQKQYSAIQWQEKLTVLGVLESAAKHPRPIRFRHRSTGETAFLEQIDDLKNEGGDGRNWIYRVNGKLADRSFAIQELQRGDTVLWNFERYR